MVETGGERRLRRSRQQPWRAAAGRPCRRPLPTQFPGGGVGKKWWRSRAAPVALNRRKATVRLAFPPFSARWGVGDPGGGVRCRSPGGPRRAALARPGGDDSSGEGCRGRARAGQRAIPLPLFQPPGGRSGGRGCGAPLPAAPRQDESRFADSERRFAIRESGFAREQREARRALAEPGRRGSPALPLAGASRPPVGRRRRRFLELQVDQGAATSVRWDCQSGSTSEGRRTGIGGCQVGTGGMPDWHGGPRSVEARRQPRAARAVPRSAVSASGRRWRAAAATAIPSRQGARAERPAAAVPTNLAHCCGVHLLPHRSDPSLGWSEWGSRSHHWGGGAAIPKGRPAS